MERTITMDIVTPPSSTVEVTIRTASLVAFLAGPDARGITGAMHTIGGGAGA